MMDNGNDGDDGVMSKVHCNQPIVLRSCTPRTSHGP
jgi:hypothetical protein